MKEIKIVESSDGSSTIFLPHMNETYHSLHGAVTESTYVFIEKGLREVKEKDVIHILEIGFGTGLNALLTIKEVLGSDRKVVYHTLEPEPLPQEVWQKVNYLGQIGDPGLEKYFTRMHECEWEVLHQLNGNFSFRKMKKKLEEADLSGVAADVVYFDAFAPNKQPEVWSLENLEKVKKAMASGGILVTYCARGQFKRDLKSLGFAVETLPGPPGKKEMTRGVI